MYGICEWCGRPLEVEPAPVEMIHYCSEECRDKYYEAIEGLKQ